MEVNKLHAVNALVTAFKDAGCGYTTNYPGSSTQDIFFGLGGKMIATNEKAAFEQAYGASLAGLKTVVTLKSVGLNACADQFLHSIIHGVNAGLVVVVVDDTQVVASQERQDSRHYFDFFGGLWLEPSTIQMAYDMAYESFGLSEKFDVPVIIRLTNQVLYGNGPFLRKRRKQFKQLQLSRRPEKFISYPVYWKRQSENLAKKNAAIQEYIESLYANRLKHKNDDSQFSVLMFGACQQELASAGLNDSSIISINHYPIPKKFILNLARQSDHFTVYEQGNDYAFTSIKNILSSASTFLSSNTGDCPDLSTQWITWSYLEKLFKALRNIHPSFVVGDVGQYTVESEHVIGACLCLGSSIGVTTGMTLAGIPYPFCIVGDASYLHGGAIMLNEAKARGAVFGVIVIDNGGSGATGGQPLVQDIHTYDQAHSVQTVDFDRTTEAQLTTILSDMRSSEKLSILYIKIKPGSAS